MTPQLKNSGKELAYPTTYSAEETPAFSPAAAIVRVLSPSFLVT